MTEKYWIIVVDDDVANLMMAGSIMSKNGMRVTALKSGKALIDYIEANETTPDLCLLDIRMPDMDGFQAEFMKHRGVNYELVARLSTPNEAKRKDFH